MSAGGEIDLEELGVVWLDGGAVPEGLLEHVAEYRKAHPRLIRPASTAEAERFFSTMAEEVKRAGGHPRC